MQGREWGQRFPQWQERLQRLFQVDQLMQPESNTAAISGWTLPAAREAEDTLPASSRPASVKAGLVDAPVIWMMPSSA